jgi:hypothetical protein
VHRIEELLAVVDHQAPDLTPHWHEMHKPMSAAIHSFMLLLRKLLLL